LYEVSAVAVVANPYVNAQLRIPENEWEAVRRYTSTFRKESGASSDIDQSPFDRYVDLWWTALCLGIREGIKSTPSSWHNFVTGVVLNQDPWRIRHLELIALAEEGDVKVLEEPGKVIDIANKYAATGIRLLVDTMTGQTEPIWALTGLLRSLAEEALPERDT
jgi:hypothetical protein